MPMRWTLLVSHISEVMLHLSGTGLLITRRANPDNTGLIERLEGLHPVSGGEEATVESSCDWWAQ